MMDLQTLGIASGILIFLFGWLRVEILNATRDVKELEKRVIANEVRIEMLREKEIRGKI